MKRKKINELEKIKPLILGVLKKYNAKKAGVFGSYARNDNRKGSDVDILVEMDGSLLALTNAELDLMKELKRKVDLLSYNGLNPLLKKQILSEEVRIL